MFKLLVFLFLCLFFFMPDKGIDGVKDGLILWYNAILPAQFPFVIGVRMFMKMVNFSNCSPILFNFAAGMTAGYPVGSLITAQLYRKGCITKKNLTALAAFSNMAGPLFVVGTVGAVLLKNIYFGYILLMVHWISAAMLSIRPVFRERKMMLKDGKTVAKLQKHYVDVDRFGNAGLEKQAIGYLLGEAVEETAQLMLKIAGFIVLFSVVKQWIGGVAGALLEMSGGIRWLADQDVDMRWKLVGCSFLINFSGVCIILQSLGTVQDCPISGLEYAGWKFLQGILSAGIMLGICQFLIL